MRQFIIVVGLVGGIAFGLVDRAVADPVTRSTLVNEYFSSDATRSAAGIDLQAPLDSAGAVPDPGNENPPGFRNARFEPQPALVSTGQLIEQGRCDAQRCGPLVLGGRTGGGAAETVPRLLTARAGRNHALIGWNPPRRGTGRGASPISAYEILLISGQDYFLYRIEGVKVRGSPISYRF